MDFLQNPIVLATANKLAFIIAAYFVHKGLIAADTQTAVENNVVGVILGLLSIGFTLYQSYKHKATNDVLAKVETTNPQAVASARIAVNAPTSNGL